jgi:hypothetical protein
MKKTPFTSKLDSILRKKLAKCHIWRSVLYGAETWTLWEKTSETAGKFSNVVLEKDGEDQLDRSCEKRSNVTQSQRGKEYPSYNEKSEG